MTYDIGPYDPCPCGSGAKYKFCCATKAKALRRGKFPIGTIAHYGPDDKTTTKIAAGVILREGGDPILQRWVATNVATDPNVADEIKRFFAKYGVKSVSITTGNIGCPHEEGIDFPRGKDCPFCPFWAGKQGSAASGDWYDDDWDEDEDEDEDDLDDDDDVDGNEDFEDEEDRDFDAAFARVDAIIGKDAAFEKAMEKLVAHLQANLTLPCEVTGIEDFQWEEPYVIGGGSPSEYKRLKKTQPSYTDRYELIGIDLDHESDWMMFAEDIAAHVRRISDEREFVLGLSELKATDKTSPNHQLLDDYAVWFANCR